MNSTATRSDAGPKNVEPKEEDELPEPFPAGLAALIEEEPPFVRLTVART